MPSNRTNSSKSSTVNQLSSNLFELNISKYGQAVPMGTKLNKPRAASANRAMYIAADKSSHARNDTENVHQLPLSNDASKRPPSLKQHGSPVQPVQMQHSWRAHLQPATRANTAPTAAPTGSTAMTAKLMSELSTRREEKNNDHEYGSGSSRGNNVSSQLSSPSTTRSAAAAMMTGSCPPSASDAKSPPSSLSPTPNPPPPRRHATGRPSYQQVDSERQQMEFKNTRHSEVQVRGNDSGAGKAAIDGPLGMNMNSVDGTDFSGSQHEFEFGFGVQRVRTMLLSRYLGYWRQESRLSRGALAAKVMDVAENRRYWPLRSCFTWWSMLHCAVNWHQVRGDFISLFTAFRTYCFLREFFIPHFLLGANSAEGHK